MRRTICLALVVGLFGLSATASAHYPWFALAPKDGKQGRVNFYFEDGPRAGDGQYLDPFIKDAAFWVRSADGKATPVKLEEVKQDGQRWLTLALETDRPRSIECYVKWGVYQGRLLFYYAKFIDVAGGDQFAAVVRADQMKFDLVPRVVDGMVEVQALWEGKPKSDLAVLVAGPGISSTLKTDDKGLIRFKPAKAGLHTLRATFIETDLAGADNGKDYKGLRQTATLAMTLAAPVK